jgi:endonuclease/exonuclease/phosphatase family metal-dependent hydrolase
MPEYSSYFAVNYDVKYLPFPWTEPLGKILGGLQTLTNRSQLETKRIALPGITDFPRKLFYLERCLMVQRMKLTNGKELVTVNAHLEAYDDGGVKRAQMKLMKELLEQEYTKGNYVVIGGDWNIAPPDFNVHKWEKEKESDPLYLMNNDSTYIKDWKYVYDGNIATNRKNNHAFNDKTFTTVIDYFYVSPNVEVVEVKGHDFGFKNSDHNPVSMKVRLK